MKYIYAIRGAFVALVLFSIAVIFIPGVGPSKEVEVLLTVTIFLFATLAGFFISRMNSRFDEIRRIIGEGDAYFLSFFKTSQMFGKSFENKIRNLIDRYYIFCYDNALCEFRKTYKKTSKTFMSIWNAVRTLKKKKPEPAFDKLLEDLNEIEKSRNIAAEISSEKMGTGQWAILILLAGIILFSIFYLMIPVLYSQIITVLLSTVLILVILIIRDLQNLMLGGKGLLEESGQEIFEFIGKPRYYNKMHIDSGEYKPPKSIKVYRVGLHKPGAKKFKIKIVKR